MVPTAAWDPTAEWGRTEAGLMGAWDPTAAWAHTAEWARMVVAWAWEVMGWG